jgi:hypothetical protein
MAPSIDTLTARFLARQSVSPEGVAASEVEPHDVLTGFRAGAASTWKDATAVLGLFGESTPMPLPPEWAAFVSQLADVSILPMGIGSIPQRVRAIAAKRSTESVAGPAHAKLSQWIAVRRKAGSPLDLIVAGAMLRAMGDLAGAESCLADAKPATEAQRQLLANERAVLLWQKGQATEALEAWEAMESTPVTVFNRAVAHWVAGRADVAEALFADAANRLPESSGWAHLAGMAMLMCGR